MAPVAVTGMAVLLPGAPDLDTYWRNLRDGVDAITHFTEAQLREAGVPAELIADPA